MKHNVRIWAWKSFVPKSTLWKDGTFVLGTGPLPDGYFTVSHMKMLVPGWIRMGAWVRKNTFPHPWFVSEQDINSYDLLKRHSWK